MRIFLGSTWNPSSISGRIGVMFALCFAIVIYNAYAAFITSMLSTSTSDINNLDDIFKGGYKVGFIAGSDDEVYLQVKLRLCCIKTQHN